MEQHYLLNFNEATKTSLYNRLEISWSKKTRNSIQNLTRESKETKLGIKIIMYTNNSTLIFGQPRTSVHPMALVAHQESNLYVLRLDFGDSSSTSDNDETDDDKEDGSGE